MVDERGFKDVKGVKGVKELIEELLLGADTGDHGHRTGIRA